MNPEPIAMPLGVRTSGHRGELRIAISTAMGPKPGERKGSKGNVEQRTHASRDSSERRQCYSVSEGA
jgi:hypothetical protein